MGATVEELGAVVLDGLRTAGYQESTVGQYEKTIRALTGFVAARGGVYTPALGAAFARLTVSPGPGGSALSAGWTTTDWSPCSTPTS